MEAHESIKKLFQLYVGKNFSKAGKVLFGRWLRAEQNQEIKENLLQQHWETTEGEISADTWKDWNLLQSQLNASLLQKKQIQLVWLKYAAVVTLFLVSVGGTYWTTKQRTLRQSAEMAELFVPYGETREILLPDSSRIWVNAGSTILYPKDFQKMDSRTIYLTGEASFQVYKNKEKPFIVKTSCVDIQALGTIFTVKSYAGEDYTTTTLEEGSVKVSLKDGIAQSYILKPSEQLIYSHENHSVQRNSVDLSLYKMTREGYLIFEDVPFLQLISTLEKKYKVTFQYNATRYGNDLYHVKFAPNETIEDVMEILHQLMGVDYAIKGNNIIVK